MINPSEINLSALPSVPLGEKSQLPVTSCIYLAIDSQGIVQYVGKASSLRLRWTNHHRYAQLQEMSGVAIAYIETPSQLLDSVEIALIEWFAPPLNRFLKESDTSNVKCNLRSYMNDLDLTQQEVAGKTGLSPTIIGRLYHSRFSRLDNQTVAKICKLFSASLGEMFYIDEDSK